VDTNNKILAEGLTIYAIAAMLGLGLAMYYDREYINKPACEPVEEVFDTQVIDDWHIELRDSQFRF